jgi:hypothetical protein
MKIANYAPGFEFNCGIPATTDNDTEVIIIRVGINIELSDATGRSDGDAYVFFDSQRIIHNDAEFLKCVRSVAVEALMDASFNETMAHAAANSIVYNAIDLQMPGRSSFSADLLRDVLRMHMASI